LPYKQDSALQLLQRVDGQVSRIAEALQLTDAPTVPAENDDCTTIEAALAEGNRIEAVNIRLAIQAREGRNTTKTGLFKAAKQDKSDYCKWERGKKKDGSAADIAIRRVLRTGWK